MPLKGKVVMITGAGSGIGRALAVDASHRGASLVLTGRRLTALQETAARVAAGTVCAIVPGDVTDAAARTALCQHVAAVWGRLDFLVNNAGVLTAGPLSDLEDATLETMVAVNLVAPLALTRDLLPLLAAARGRVVNIGSLFGDIPYPLFTAYCATKHGLRGLSGALRREVRDLGIGVSHAAPRGAHTPALNGLEAVVEPLGMRLDEPEDIARTIWDGALRGADTIYPTGPERLYGLIQALLPGLLDRVINRQLRRAGMDDAIRHALRPAALPR